MTNAATATADARHSKMRGGRRVIAVKASIRSGSREVHIPKLWYYDQLLFLTDEEDTKCSTVDSMLIDPFEDMGEIDSNDFDSTAIKVMSPSSESSASEQCTSPASNATKHKRSKIQTEDALSRILDKLDEQKPPQEKRQKYEAFGEHISEKLRSLPDNMATHCQKLINDAVYLAELGRLDINSHIVTTNPDQNVNVSKFPKSSEESGIIM
ncbi:unnamed protein product [Callosobruchus maculatus]|uniref:Uncharacterized protein n=1 Tax=Callosobruchus maculatus TaxID=64391 RepID=A0A653C7I2_CALMS|nr:unnamed protein product [Callosobruchus maculatus]